MTELSRPSHLLQHWREHNAERRNWQELHRKSIAEKKEYYTNSFNFF